MKRKTKVIVFGLSAVFLVIAILLYIRLRAKDMVIATVNGEAVYQSDFDRIKELNSSLSNEEIVELIMKELLVYQEAVDLGFAINDEIVEGRISSLKEEMPDLYMLCIEQYGSEAAYKKALSYTMLYDMVYEYYSEEYISSLDYNADDIKREAIECNYISKDEVELDEERIIKMYLKEKYRDEIRNYFEQWNNDEFEKANKQYKNLWALWLMASSIP